MIFYEIFNFFEKIQLCNVHFKSFETSSTKFLGVCYDFSFFSKVPSSFFTLEKLEFNELIFTPASRFVLNFLSQN